MPPIALAGAPRLPRGTDGDASEPTRGRSRRGARLTRRGEARENGLRISNPLNLHGMKALWGREVSDLGFGTFVQTLHYVAAKTSTIVHHIDPWFLSTTLCSVCGHLNDAITLRDRVWTCEVCETTYQRDRNAATDIYREGRLPLEEVVSARRCRQQPSIPESPSLRVGSTSKAMQREIAMVVLAKSSTPQRKATSSRSVPHQAVAHYQTYPSS